MSKSQPSNFRANERQQEIRGAYVYVVIYGESTLYYCNYDQDVIVTGGPSDKMSDPQTFTASQISHTKPNQSVELNPTSVSVTLPSTGGAVRKYFISAPTGLIRIYIYRVSSASMPGPLTFDDDLYLEFVGEGQANGFADYAVTATFNTLLLQSDNQIPRIFYQKTCNHDLYGAFCSVVKELYALATDIAALSRVNRTVDITATSINVDSPSRNVVITDETYEGGYLVDSDGNQIGIVACQVLDAGAGTRLYLQWWSSAMVVTAAITVYPGCKKIPRICHDIFRNTQNLLSTPYIPTSNPAINGIAS